MKLGVYTISIQAMFLAAKLLGLADNVSWGFILAPAFFHAGGMTVLIVQHHLMRKAYEQLQKEMADD